MLEEDAIMDDLKLLSKVSGKPLIASHPSSHNSQNNKKLHSSLLATAGTSPIVLIEARISDECLYYDKKT